MTKISPIAAAITLVTLSASVHAWWDNNWADRFFGDGFGAGAFDFSFSMRARGNGYGRGYGYNAPYWDYVPPYGITPPMSPALTEEQQAAMAEQQRALAIQRQKSFEQAVTAQREFVERLNRDMMAPPIPELPADINQRIREHEAQRDAMIRERESQHNIAPGEPPRSEERQRQVENSQIHRNEMVKQIQEHRDSTSSNPLMPESMSQPNKEM